MKGDQIKVILDSIGKQDEDDLSFISSSYASEYVTDLSKVDNSTNLPLMNKNGIQSEKRTNLFEKSEVLRAGLS